MNNRIEFTPKDILQKDFRQRIRGYDPTEVDKFLDTVISDYQSFGRIIRQLRGENNSLRYHLDNVASEKNPSTQPRTQKVEMNNTIYADILKRLKRLEERMPQ